MKISELPYVSSIDDASYVLAVQGGSTVRATATAFKGTPGIDGFNGEGVPTGGVAGQILRKVDSVDFNTEWYTQATTTVDLSGATSDYELSVGEAAYINYTSVSSISLRVRTLPGEYELIINGSLSDSATDVGAVLTPNYGGSVPASNSIILSDFFRGSNAPNTFIGEYYTNRNNFYLCSGVPIKVVAKISTFTNCKNCFGNSVGRQSTNSKMYDIYFNQWWTNTTTEWTSLGQIAFGSSQTGRIIVRRVL